jgi:hypothetical protein
MLGFMIKGTPTEPVDDRGRLSGTTKEDEIIGQAKEAAERIRSNDEYAAYKAWPDWRTIGLAFQLGQSDAMRAAETNEPQGPRYRKCYGEWLTRTGLAEIADKDVRCRLLYLIENIDAVDRWLQTLPSNQREKMNHPNRCGDHLRSQVVV